jgi:hypothetical protein
MCGTYILGNAPSPPLAGKKRGNVKKKKIGKRIKKQKIKR